MRTESRKASNQCTRCANGFQNQKLRLRNSDVLENPYVENAGKNTHTVLIEIFQDSSKNLQISVNYY